MNARNIRKHLTAKMDDWLESIDDKQLCGTIRQEAIITGGAIVSLLNNETPNDYDVYFKTKEACLAVANYYVDKWNEAHSESDKHAEVREEDGQVKVFIQNVGVAAEDDYSDSDERDYDLDLKNRFGGTLEDESETPDEKETSEKTDHENKPKYRPVYLTSNAITLSNKIQIVIRFYGDVDEIHKNYDFVHCTCSWTYYPNNLNLPSEALEAIINKELVYIGSRYPLCSLMRVRKYLDRGYHINAGQLVKMAFQIHDLDLKNIKVLQDQLMGVDSGYFSFLIDALSKKYSGTEEVETNYVIELLNRMF